MFESGIWKVSDFAALVLLQSVNSLFSNTGLVLQANHSYSARVSLTWLFQSFKHSNLFINEVAREVCHNCRELSTYVAEIAIIRGRCARTIFIHESALNQKKRTTERSERVSFLIHRNEWLKIIRVHFPWYDVFILYTQRFTLLSTKRTTVKIHRSSNQSHEQ